MVRTQRRDDILRAMVDAAEGTLVPNELPDQAGAVRDRRRCDETEPHLGDPNR